MDTLVKQFGSIISAVEVPHLLTLQLDSYKKFLQLDVDPVNRADIGLESVFRSVFPIKDYNETAQLEYISYEIGKPKYDVNECIAKGQSYEAPVYIQVRIVVFDIDEDTGARSVRDLKEEGIYFGTLQLMTDKGTFIINGTERVIVNQLQRSPGIVFEHDNEKTHPGSRLYSSRIIPMRGSWLDFDFDPKGILYVRIDRRKKFPATVLLRALGMSGEQILDYFYDKEIYKIENGRLFRKVEEKFFRKENLLAFDVKNAAGEVLAAAGDVLKLGRWKKIARSGIEWMEVALEDCDKLYSAVQVVQPQTGEILVEAGGELSVEIVQAFEQVGIKEFATLFTSGSEVSASIRNTLMLDKVADPEQAQIEIYKRLRPSSPPNSEVAATYFDNLFRNPDYYDLSAVGRYKLNTRFGLDLPLDFKTLSNEDILETVKYLTRLKNTNGAADDIDHLGNRRVRPVGELVENQYRMGLVRMERAIKERMSLQEVTTLMPHDLINPKPVTAVLKEFFGTSQLSQFMDQTNPLSEVTHKRRLSALGPGGLTRERAGFDVRDVHPSHYGRICPIETPEGPNIGLIMSMTTHGRVNDFGFIETPYRKVKNGKVIDEIEYFDASKETGHIIAQANVPLAEDGHFVDDFVAARREGEFSTEDKSDITLMDITPSQVVSVSAALIPFLEHDDANRALMGSNMMRQAVPLLQTERPLVGTGMESVVARDSGSCILAEGSGVVQQVDADRIVVCYDSEAMSRDTGGVKVYELQKFHKSNQNSSFGQKPLARPGQKVKKGDILADGPAISYGELALGKNLLVAFMPWCGFNYEDAVLISERVVKEDIYTSVHIEEFELLARDTKLGPEEVTRDIPNVGEDILRNLDDSGIIRIGAHVIPDDILVGKITPKGETQLTPEERLLHAIFGDKARDVKNTSLKVPPGIEGTVIDVKVFNRRSGDRDERTKVIEEMALADLERKEQKHIDGLVFATKQKIWKVVEGKRLKDSILGSTKGKVIVEANHTVKFEDLEQIPLKKFKGVFVTGEVNSEVKDLLDDYDRQLGFIKAAYDEKREKVSEGDDLQPGVIKKIKVYVAVKRKLSVGDKMAGRHGNKGVVSCILPEEDMPFFADGTPVDVVLNPLGVPSRMNIGQIMETHLGWAAKELGVKFADMLESGVATEKLRQEVKELFSSETTANSVSELIDGMDEEEFLSVVKRFRSGLIAKTPIFDGASEDDIWGWLKKAGLPEDGKSVLYDGRTGEPFYNRVTVGYMYYLKLHHLVDEKIHARSTGPYSLVTQQPLGGKAQFGGQRLGEMEVWALEAYGASHMLQEFLTVKSDDVAGRVKMYEKIVKGGNFLESGLPESFNVLIKEMMALGLDISLIEEEKKALETKS